MVVALMITLLFIIFVIPGQNKNFRDQRINVLKDFLYNDEFREAVLSENQSLVRNFLEQRFNTTAKNYNFTFIITQNPNLSLTFANKDVFSESIFIYNKTNTSKYKILRIYYWKK